MAHYKVNRKDVFFVLKNQLGYGSLCRLPRYKGLDEKSLDLLISEAVAFARDKVAPLQELCEQPGVRFENGKVACPPEFARVFRDYGENGWTAASRSTTYGGMGFPHMMRIVVNEMMYGACQAFNMAPSLTHGAAHLVESFADQALKKLFVPPCYTGKWSGTMCLTEADAGSNLAEIKTTAARDGDAFRIKGTKVFISWGDHDLTENIVHLVLARIEGAPEGVKGISLFIVPKFRVNPDGTPGRQNDVVCRNVEEKLGLHGSPTCTLEFGASGACMGFLCGKENEGLAHMFQMMNQARINTGVSGMTLASTAYQNALAYAKVRVQGRDVSGQKPGSVSIIEHPDVRRMLLWMKGMVEGMRSMIYTAALWSDLALELPEGEEKTRCQDLVDFMTPVIKAFCSETGFRVCETAIQCLGGYGFCRDYPLEQYLRDAKIMSLYEGTNGIQALDLWGRKMLMRGGAPFTAFLSELGAFTAGGADHPVLGMRIQALKDAADQLADVARQMGARRKEDPLQWASYLYPGLMCIGEIVLCWRLLDLAVVALREAEKAGESDFLTGKVLTATCMADTLLPVTRTNLTTCLRSGREIADMPVQGF
ncbi:MAG: acyl-CoA dehydrogenase [Thermodesulfobacteriota bacterium]